MIHVLPDPEALAEAAAALFIGSAHESIEARGRFAVALSGGRTPIATYRALAGPRRHDLDWSRVHLFWGDERLVPPDHPDSNYRLVRESLLAGAPVPEANVHRVPTELGSAPEAAAAYEATLGRWFGLSPGEPPRLDFLLQGLGGNGHTASLMPGCPALAETERWVASCSPDDCDLEDPQHPRVTLTFPAINAGRRVVFLVSGSAKAEVLARVIEGDEPPEVLPATGVRPERGELRWLLDEAAAARLAPETLTTKSRARGAAEGTAP